MENIKRGALAVKPNSQLTAAVMPRVNSPFDYKKLVAAMRPDAMTPKQPPMGMPNNLTQQQQQFLAQGPQQLQVPQSLNHVQNPYPVYQGPGGVAANAAQQLLANGQMSQNYLPPMQQVPYNGGRR